MILLNSVTAAIADIRDVTLNLSNKRLGTKPRDVLRQAFAVNNVTTMDLENNSLDLKTAEELRYAFVVIKAKKLNLSANRLGVKTGEELRQAFEVVRAASLNLSVNHLGAKSGEELRQFFEVIVATTLNLSSNYLGERSGEELRMAFSVIKARTLDLRTNKLELRTWRELRRAFAVLNAVKLNLEGNHLGDRTGEDLRRIFIVIKATTLDLNFNYLGNRTGEELRRAFEVIKATKLDLSFNYLEKRTGKELRQAFEVIKAAELDLSSNELGNLSGEELGEAFEVIKATKLDLSGNKLGNRTWGELGTAIAVIKAITLDLSNNNLGCIQQRSFLTNASNFFQNGLFFGYRSDEKTELEKLFAAFKATNLNLSLNHLGDIENSELAKALAAMSHSVKEIDLTANGFGEKSDDELKVIFAPLVNSVVTRTIVVEERIRIRLQKLFPEINALEPFIVVARLVEKHIDDLSVLKTDIDQLMPSYSAERLILMSNTLPSVVEIQDPIELLTYGLFLANQFPIFPNYYQACGGEKVACLKQAAMVMINAYGRAIKESLKQQILYQIWELRALNSELHERHPAMEKYFSSEPNELYKTIEGFLRQEGFADIAASAGCAINKVNALGSLHGILSEINAPTNTFNLDSVIRYLNKIHRILDVAINESCEPALKDEIFSTLNTNPSILEKLNTAEFLDLNFNPAGDLLQRVNSRTHLSSQQRLIQMLPKAVPV